MEVPQRRTATSTASQCREGWAASTEVGLLTAASIFSLLFSFFSLHRGFPTREFTTNLQSVNKKIFFNPLVQNNLLQEYVITTHHHYVIELHQRQKFLYSSLSCRCLVPEP